MAPLAQHLYACDHKWWQINLAEVNKHYSGKKWIQNKVQAAKGEPHYDFAKRHNLRVIRGNDGRGLGDPHINYGSNSGYQAINIAYLWGATDIILLGYDMQRTNNKVHFFGDHPKELHNGPAFHAVIPLFKPLADDLAAKGVRVINCTRQTALPYFERQDLRDALQLLSAQAQA